MKRHHRLATSALAGLVAAGSLAVTLAPAAAAERHDGGWNRDRGHVVYRHDDYGRWNRGYVASAPAYVYPAPAYVAPAYPVYVPQNNGYLHVAAPGFSFGLGF